jgi:hypothetical protein
MNRFEASNNIKNLRSRMRNRSLRNAKHAFRFGAFWLGQSSKRKRNETATHGLEGHRLEGKTSLCGVGATRSIPRIQSGGSKGGPRPEQAFFGADSPHPAAGL